MVRVVRMIVPFVAFVATPAIAAAAPVDPAALTVIEPKPASAASAKGGTEVAIFATGVDVDHLLWTLGPAAPDLVLRSSQRQIDGRIGEPAGAGVPGPIVVETLLDGVDVVRIPRRKGRAKDAVVLDSFAASPIDLLRILADVARVDLVVARTRELPRVTILARDTRARDTAEAVARAAGLELHVKSGAWIVVEPGTTLDKKLLAKRAPGDLQLRLFDARPGDARRLIDPGGPAEADVCPDLGAARDRRPRG